MAALCFALLPADPLSHSHVAPHFDCTCGLWAFRDENRARSLVKTVTKVPLRASSPTVNALYGSISLWGRVVEHEQGFRAEFGYPSQIVVPRNFRALIVRGDGRTTRRIEPREAASRLRDLYRVEVIIEPARRRRAPVADGQETLL